MKKPKNLRNKFSFSVTISFQPNFLRRSSTCWLVIPCLMSASSHSSGTVKFWGPAVSFFQNCEIVSTMVLMAVQGGQMLTCQDFLGLPPSSSSLPPSACSAALGSL